MSTDREDSSTLHRCASPARAANTARRVTDLPSGGGGASPPYRGGRGSAPGASHWGSRRRGLRRSKKVRRISMTSGTVRRRAASPTSSSPERTASSLYSFMYGPAMEKPCPMCTAMLDSLNGPRPHATQRVNLAVVAKLSARAHSRLRPRARMAQPATALIRRRTRYNRDYHARRGRRLADTRCSTSSSSATARCRHFYATELFFAKTEAGQNPRHVDSIWPLWNLFDLTPEGRGEDWYPRLSY